MTQTELQRRDKIARSVARKFARRFPRVEYDDALQNARVAYLSASFDKLDATANPDATLARCLYFRLCDGLRRETIGRGKTPRPETFDVSTVDAQRAERGTGAETLENVALSRWVAAERRERVVGWVRRAVEKTLSQSPERVGELYRACFVRGETMRTAGAAFGLSESRTSQILTEFKRDVAQNLRKERAEK